jgi:hypothetical protein
VEFAPPEHGKAMTRTATYRAAIKVWVRADGAGRNTLVDVVDVTGTGPGFVSSADVRCFDPTSREQRKPGMRPK